ncbi:cell division protein FtsQ/DivIB [Oceanobacillus jeddahense]|uniref:Cell division protein DivIB n=1 Tax=Oceanobacillus jeddahense TaxID=1462527 RepID=A0ABY5JMU5_9BACI|nr:FtsQ-type POTRA domain-containing protein [Oceanobacillus jeddahense]UUI01625.1 FtsQ-type POTRA domain-containing protein [Oceanobacillus jeddahense]
MSDKNIVSIEDRIPKLKQARKKKANRRLIFYLSVFFLLIAIIVYLQSPWSEIRSIEVNGNVFLTDEYIIDESGLTEGNNIWSMNGSSAATEIEEDPVIEQASISRSFPSTVVIEVEEQPILGYVQDGREFYPVLADGQVIQQNGQGSISNAPLITGFNEDQLTELATAMNDVRPSIFNMISEIERKESEEDEDKLLIRLYMSDGFLVEGSADQMLDKLDYYPSIVTQLEEGDSGIIHIGVGVYFESFQKDETEEVDIEDEIEELNEEINEENEETGNE